MAWGIQPCSARVMDDAVRRLWLPLTEAPRCWGHRLLCAMGCCLELLPWVLPGACRGCHGAAGGGVQPAGRLLVPALLLACVRVLETPHPALPPPRYPLVWGRGGLSEQHLSSPGADNQVGAGLGACPGVCEAGGLLAPAPFSLTMGKHSVLFCFSSLWHGVGWTLPWLRVQTGPLHPGYLYRPEQTGRLLHLS